MANDRSKLVKPDWLTDEQFAGLKDATASLQKIRGDAQADVADYLAHPDGRASGATAKMGIPTLLLTTIGRKSGEQRTVPLNFVRDGDKLAIVGSLAGYDRHPTWYLNIKANPKCWVQLDRQKMAAVARDATEAERNVFWPKLTGQFPALGYFQSQTARLFPIVVLSPTGPA